MSSRQKPFCFLSYLLFHSLSLSEQGCLLSICASDDFPLVLHYFYKKRGLKEKRRNPYVTPFSFPQNFTHFHNIMMASKKKKKEDKQFLHDLDELQFATLRQYSSGL